MFGRGAEEWSLAFEQGIDAELIPGITSAIAVPGLAGIPLTHRRLSQSFAVITGHCQHGLMNNWANYARIDTLVILMGVKNRAASEPVAFIYRGTTPHERVVESTLGEVAADSVQIANPAVFVIGEVVKLRARLTATPAQPESEDQE